MRCDVPVPFMGKRLRLAEKSYFEDEGDKTNHYGLCTCGRKMVGFMFKEMMHKILVPNARGIIIKEALHW